jgi:hypothetical protein
MEDLDRTSSRLSVAVLHPWTSMRLRPMAMCERPGIPATDAKEPSRVNFTSHIQSERVTVEVHMGRI